MICAKSYIIEHMVLWEKQATFFCWIALQLAASRVQVQHPSWRASPLPCIIIRSPLLISTHMMIFAFTLMLTLLLVTLLVIVRFSLEMYRLKRGSERIMHNRCYTDRQEIHQTHGNMEPHI